jgi:hypothetical protein
MHLAPPALTETSLAESSRSVFCFEIMSQTEGYALSAFDAYFEARNPDRSGFVVSI